MIAEVLRWSANGALFIPNSPFQRLVELLEVLGVSRAK